MHTINRQSPIIEWIDVPASHLASLFKKVPAAIVRLMGRGTPVRILVRGNWTDPKGDTAFLNSWTLVQKTRGSKAFFAVSGDPYPLRYKPSGLVAVRFETIIPQY